MPTPLAHSFCGLLFYPETKKYVLNNKVYAVTFIVFLSCLPDFDYFWGMLSGDLKAGHRLLTHSLFFPLAIGIILGIVSKLFKKKFLPLFILTILLIGPHIFLDYLSFDNFPQNGIGVSLFWPLVNKFFIFPFHPIANRFADGPFELIFIIMNDFCFTAIFLCLFIGRRAYRKIQ